MCVGVFNNSDSGSNYEIKQKAEGRGSIKRSVKEESLHNLKQKKALTNDYRRTLLRFPLSKHSGY